MELFTSTEIFNSISAGIYSVLRPYLALCSLRRSHLHSSSQDRGGPPIISVFLLVYVIQSNVLCLGLPTDCCPHFYLPEDSVQYRDDMWSARRFSHAVVGFLDQDCRYKSVATQIPRVVRLEPVRNSGDRSRDFACEAMTPPRCYGDGLCNM